ncbi:MAG: peptidase [Massilia sp.]|nr:peptidase [Massilia sp.]
MRACNRPALCAVLLGTAACVCGPAAALDLPIGNGARFNVPVASMKAVRFRHTLHQQYDFSCGSAAVATLLTFHYGTPVDERAVFTQMFLQGDQRKIRREGFSLLDIKRFLATRGFKADGFRQPLQKLFDAGLPAIVLISEKGYQHFVVIKGAADGRILLGDPATGTRAMARDAFEQLWTNKLLFVIHGAPRRPVFNERAQWRAAPAAPLDTALYQDALRAFALGKNGPGDY